MSKISEYPKISIVTPSYNQGQFLEETIRSVLLQGYPNLEYIIIDGGSTDNSVEIIKKYATWITYWKSEKDRGQADAINQGLAMATGDILGWLNSDDTLLPGALESVAMAIQAKQVDWVAGLCYQIDDNGTTYSTYVPDNNITPEKWTERFLVGITYTMPQPSVFWTRKIWLHNQPLREDLHYSFDHEFFLRLCSIAGQPLILDEALSCFRHHSDSKTISSQSKFAKENIKIGIENLNVFPLLTRLKFRIMATRASSRLALHDTLFFSPNSQIRINSSDILSLILKHPILLADRMLWGGLKQEWNL